MPRTRLPGRVDIFEVGPRDGLQAGGIEFASVLASMEAGIDVIDSAAGGLGGCPYAPGATGNIATETLVEMLHRLRIETGIDEEKIKAAALTKLVNTCGSPCGITRQFNQERPL